MVEFIEQLWSRLGVFKDGNRLSFLGFFEAFLEIGVGFEAGMSNDCEIRGKIGEVKRFLDGGISTTDDGDMLPFYKVAVAEGAVRNWRLRREVEMLRGGAGGNKDLVGADRFVVDEQLEVVGITPELLTLTVDDFGASLDGLGTHFFGKTGAKTVETGIISEVRDFSECATNAAAFKDFDFEPGASGIEGGGKCGRAAANNGEVAGSIDGLRI